MIRALQKKFVVTAMIAVTILLLVVLGALNVFNAVSNARQTEFLLDDLGRRQAAFFPRTEDDAPPPAAAGSEPGSGSPGISAEGPPGSFESGRRRGFLDEPMDDNMRMSALYFVADLDDQGRVLRTDVSHIASVSEDEAAELALGLDVEQTGGSVGSYRYKIYPRPEGGYRIVFLDSAVRRNAVTRVAREAVGDDASFLRVRIDTGRTNQIRRHLASIRFPIVGDRVFGLKNARDPKLMRVPRQMLHASSLELPHPLKPKETIKAHSPLPADFRSALALFGMGK